MPERQLRRQGKLLTLVLVLTVLSVGTMAVIAILGLPKIFSGADNSEVVKRGNEMQACRSQFAAAVTDARDRSDDLILRVVKDSIVRDQTDVLALAVDPPGPRRSLIDQARADKRQANREYQMRIRQSRTDPDAFLRACRKLNA